jgi:4-aminobutyrate aminotransferase-like enzyme
MGGQTPIPGLNRPDGAMSGAPDAGLQERLARRQATFGAASALSYAQPIELVRGHGVHLYDAQGNQYLDMHNNVPAVGHSHPHVVSAIAAQSARLNIHTRYLSRLVEDYAVRLLSHFPAPLSHLTMTCTGSESNDLALRIATAVTGARGFIVTRAAYHGNTAALAAISPSSFVTVQAAPHVRLIPAPAAGGDVAGLFAAAVHGAIAELQAAGIGFAALIADSIFSSDGIFADPAGFLRPAVAAVHAAGGLFIADELQSGFGRTGAGLWGFARHGVTPDIVTLGKPMGNGFPMGGVVTKPDHMTRFCLEAAYFNTFGGNTVAAAAGDAVLDVLEDENLIDNAATTGALLTAGLETLRQDFAAIGGLRGAGLFIGLDCCDPASGAPDAQLANRVINGLREKFILIGTTGPHGHTLKIRPPLCFTAEHAGQFLDRLRDVLRAA